jgi:hypothetical protein
VIADSKLFILDVPSGIFTMISVEDDRPSPLDLPKKPRSIFQDFPAEILVMICEIILDESNFESKVVSFHIDFENYYNSLQHVSPLTNLCLTSRSLYYAAVPLLYKHIVLEPCMWQSSLCLLRTLVSTDRGKYVQTLGSGSYYPAPFDESYVVSHLEESWTKQEIIRFDEHSHIFHSGAEPGPECDTWQRQMVHSDNRAVAALLFLPNLRKLRICLPEQASMGFEFFKHRFESARKHGVHRLDLFPTISSLEISGCNHAKAPSTISLAHILGVMPGLKSIRLHGMVLVPDEVFPQVSCPDLESIQISCSRLSEEFATWLYCLGRVSNLEVLQGIRGHYFFVHSETMKRLRSQGRLDLWSLQISSLFKNGNYALYPAAIRSVSETICWFPNLRFLELHGYFLLDLVSCLRERSVTILPKLLTLQFSGFPQPSMYLSYLAQVTPYTQAVFPSLNLIILGHHEECTVQPDLWKQVFSDFAEVGTKLESRVETRWWIRDSEEGNICVFWSKQQ